MLEQQMGVTAEFLSTPSARRATCPSWAAVRVPKNFYPRPPRGGRRIQPRTSAPTSYISIHALREEGDTTRPLRSTLVSNFYPRPPRGGRQLTALLAEKTEKISIHALREEGDVT